MIAHSLGESSLYTGERRRKDDARFEALGSVDELNSHIGYLALHLLPVPVPEYFVFEKQRVIANGNTPISISPIPISPKPRW